MDLVLTNVSKNFGGLRAVSDVTFTVPSRSIFGLIGPNGAGKTTVFNLITGVYKHDTGGIHFGGTDLKPKKPAQIASVGIARTFQNIRLFAGLSVIDNVTVATHRHRRDSLVDSVLRLPRFSAEEREATDAARKLLDTFGLLPMAELGAEQLSYGLRRRLEIARALATRPKLLLLDEPAAGMNPSEADDLMHLIRWVRETFGVSILLIEHHMAVVMGICERILVLDHGARIAEGTPEEIRRDPKVIEAYLGADTDLHGGPSAGVTA